MALAEREIAHFLSHNFSETTIKSMTSRLLSMTLPRHSIILAVFRGFSGLKNSLPESHDFL